MLIILKTVKSDFDGILDPLDTVILDIFPENFFIFPTLAAILNFERNRKCLF